MPKGSYPHTSELQHGHNWKVKPSYNPKRLEEILLNNRHIDANGCWIWIGKSCDKRGRGYLQAFGKLTFTHRISAFLYLGFDLNSDKVIMHKCDNPPCFNPNHLVIGTQQDNIRDAMTKGRLKRRS